MKAARRSTPNTAIGSRGAAGWAPGWRYSVLSFLITPHANALPVPNLIAVQSTSYARFLQKDVKPESRKNEGLEALLREVFPIESYDGNLRLEYIAYDLAEPRYTTDECRALRLTYGMPFRIQVKFSRKDKDEVQEDSIRRG